MRDPNQNVYNSFGETEPIAEDILMLLIGKKISYFKCFEALEIAKDKLLTNSFPIGVNSFQER